MCCDHTTRILTCNLGTCSHRYANASRVARRGEPLEILGDLMSQSQSFELQTTETLALGLDTTDTDTLRVLAYGARPTSASHTCRIRISR